MGHSYTTELDGTFWRGNHLIRKLLLCVESQPDETPLNHNSLKFDGYDDSVIREHVRLLKEANYIHATIAKSQGTAIKGFVIFRLLNEGHDFIAATKDESVWSNVKQVIQEKGGNLPVPIIAGLATQFLKQSLGL